MEPVFLRPGEGETIRLGASSAAFKAVRQSTGGAFSMAETTIEPGFPGPVPHIHRELYDCFYVLEGTLTVRIGDEVHEAPPGTFACIPPGTVHTFSNPTAVPVRFLNINAPGGWEAYLRDIAAAAPKDRPPDPATMAEIASRYDFEPAP